MHSVIAQFELVTEATKLLKEYGLSAVTAGSLVCLAWVVRAFINELRSMRVEAETKNQQHRADLERLADYHLKRADAHAVRAEQDKAKLAEVVSEISDATKTANKELVVAIEKNTDMTAQLVRRLEK